ncbi:MFS general substrate transporter [Hyaloscypha variabilis F]|uniref:MFS general substrate transporter n=1 Tax=Hyaloscypha variabilis (strain UAMH 11265 / GT02V1 / F) TaxID=1149755 RepID=A0A2J6RJA6_HYAVF|nr:MFS general substrate transporter [Hyaloscypha variabilis F]
MDSKVDPEAAQQATIETVEDPTKYNGLNGEHHAGKDRAADLLGNTNERVIVSEADNKRILRRIDLAILPIMLGVYFLQQLDKSTLSYASVSGLIADAHLGGQDYSWLGSIVYIAQLVMQPVVAYFLVKLPTGKFAACMVLCWGVVLSCMAAAKTFKSLLATRFFLGCFEASVAPTFIAITQMWWRRREQTYRNASWYAMNGVTNMVGSLLAYGLAHIHSDKLYSYQIIFLTCGLLTVLFSILVFFFLPDSPIDAKFLNDHDKVLAVERLRANQMGVVSTEWKWEHVTESLLDVKTWCWFALIFSISIPSGGITTFGPLIVNSFGFSTFNTLLLNIPFGAVQIVATMGGAAFATWTKRKGPALALLCIPPIAGIVMLLCIKHTTENRGPLLVGYYLISFYPGISPLIYSWSSQNTAGETKKKTTTAVLFIGQSAGNIIGPHLYTTAEKPLYRRGLISNLVLFIVLIIIIAFTTVYLMWLNKRHANKRVAMGKSEVIVDRSMMNSSERMISDQVDEANGEGAWAVGGEKAFDDITDLKNEDFIFVY